MAYLNPPLVLRKRGPTSLQFPSTTPSAERMRRHRERRRRGLRCLTIELSDIEIAAPIRMGLLSVETRNNPRAIGDALYEHFERTLALIS
jgi:hypothetical protein